MKWLEEMTSNGYKPSIEDLKVLNYAYVSLESLNINRKWRSLHSRAEANQKVVKGMA